MAERHAPPVLRTLDNASRAARLLHVDHTPAFFLRRVDGAWRALEPSALTAEAFTTVLDDAVTGR